MKRMFVLLAFSCLAVVGGLLPLMPFTPANAQPIPPGEAVEFYEFVFVEFGGRPGHQGYFPRQDVPAPGEQATIRVKLFGPVQSARLELLGTAGNILAEILLGQPPGTAAGTPTFYGTLAVPTEPFRVRAIGLDSIGGAFVAGLPAEPLFTPQTLQIKLVPLSSILTPGTPARFHVQLVNYGAPDSFMLSATNTPSSPLALSPTVVSLASRQFAVAEIATVVPENHDPLAQFTLRVSAVGVATQAMNSASLALDLATRPGQPLVVDVHPGSCENPINARSRGVTPVAVMATTQFDPTRIDPRSVHIAGSVFPVRFSVQDVGSPRDEDCSNRVADGRLDLMLFFDTQQLVAAINSMMPAIVQTRTLEISIPLSGRTYDGIECFGFGTARLRN